MKAITTTTKPLDRLAAIKKKYAIRTGRGWCGGSTKGGGREERDDSKKQRRRGKRDKKGALRRIRKDARWVNNPDRSITSGFRKKREKNK